MGNSPAVVALPPKPRLTAQKVLWGAFTLALSNIATVLKQFKDILEFLGQLKSIEKIPPWVLEGLMCLGVIVGNVIVFRFLFDKIKSRILPGRTVAAAVIAVVFISAVIVTNVYSAIELRSDPSIAKKRLLTEATRAQSDGDKAGFRIYANNLEAKQDSWTTAQALTAIISTSSNPDKDRLKAAFNYIENKHLDDGWNADPNDQNSFIRTEISCWVAIAYFSSLLKPNLWTPEESIEASKKANAIMQDIVAHQDTTGAWAPIIGTAPANDRTYPTVMAVWALSEALKIPDVPKSQKVAFGRSLDNGITWLLGKYRIGYGWGENPSIQSGARFDGLNYQALLILRRAEDLAGNNRFKDEEQYKAIKRDVVNLFPIPVEVVSKTQIPSSDISVEGKICWATFPAYPWSLAALSYLVDDKDVSSSDQRKLRKIRKEELAKLKDLPSYLSNAETWEIAENLIGLSYVHGSESAK